MSIERIQQHFRDAAALALESLEALHLPVAAAVDAMFTALANGNKIVACGSGASASSAERLAAALVGGFERERPGLPALALSAAPVLAVADPAAGTGAEGDHPYARQLHALGQAGDVLFAIDPSGASPACLAAVRAAHEREMQVITLTGQDGGALGQVLADTDLSICVPSTRTSRIDEIHLVIVHSLCDGIDAMLMGED